MLWSGGRVETTSLPPPRPSPLAALGVATPPPRRAARARLLAASKGHMPPRPAENRKPCRSFEGSPVIHQGMTVQLLVPIL